jgi:multidrug efflux system outer membrane protein
LVELLRIPADVTGSSLGQWQKSPQNTSCSFSSAKTISPMSNSDRFGTLGFFAIFWLTGIGLLLSGCAANVPPPTVAVAAPLHWYASLPASTPSTDAASKAARPLTPADSLPHHGSLTSLSQWWQQQHDALLVDMIDAAQIVSPTVITARSNILQAQAAKTAAAAALLPTAGAVGSLNRGVNIPFNRNTPAPITTAADLGLQTTWEIDLFGQNEASLKADNERLLGSQALWHQARILVAAEVASQYYGFRACEQLLAVTRADAKSRLETSRLSDLLTKAGFGAPATAALARASAAEGNSRITQQRAECEVSVKALTALTGWREPELQQKLAQSPVAPPQQGMQAISRVPAEVLSQRPDVFNAARELNAASFEVGSARAQRYPRLSISGSIAANRQNSLGTTQRFTTWSIGPLALTVPLFDGGAADANIKAAKARYEEAAGKYRSVVRQAVREVEEALVTLQSTADRSSDTAVAAQGYQASFAGTEARYKAGLASLVELEDARRVLLQAQTSVVLLDRERRNAWIGLYKALGGGWTPDVPQATPMIFGVPEAALPEK